MSSVKWICKIKIILDFGELNFMFPPALILGRGESMRGKLTSVPRSQSWSSSASPLLSDFFLILSPGSVLQPSKAQGPPEEWRLGLRTSSLPSPIICIQAEVGEMSIKGSLGKGVKDGDRGRVSKGKLAAWEACGRERSSPLGRGELQERCMYVSVSQVWFALDERVTSFSHKERLSKISQALRSTLSRSAQGSH